MKKALLLFLISWLLFTGKILSQTTVSLSGYPIVTTGWVMGGSTTAAVDSEIRLTTSGTGQNGYVYYNTLLNVTACGQFSVDFDWQIKNGGGIFPGLADGIAFYMINPMTTFISGSGLGLPSPLTGFVFTLDTWDNDGDGLNPECELMGYSSPTTYNEGAAAYHIPGTGILPHVAYMGDGAWHHCRITYNAGIIRVYMNGSTTPSMTGTFPIITSGYFGFSASTGAAYSTQSIKRVAITYNTISTILGTTTICQGNTSPLYDSTAGGVWSSSVPGVATVGTSSGIVTGVNPGTTVITYSYNSGACTATTTVNVVSPPGSITGPASLCLGSGATFSDPPGTGTWSSSTPGVASIGSSSGFVTTGTTGTTVITYSTGPACSVNTTLNVVSVPGAITGTFNVCTGSTTTLSDPTPGGTWASSNTFAATIGSSSGTVYPVAPGSTIITYSIGGICTTTTLVTVNATPPAISIPGPVCVGSTVTLTDGTTGGTWVSGATGIATIDLTLGTTGGVSSGNPPITYTAPDGCTVTAIMTVNPLPTISSVSSLCAGTSTPFFGSPPGGTWSTGGSALATIDPVSGTLYAISGGTPIVTYTSPAGCVSTSPILILPSPLPIAGTLTVCPGSATLLTDPSGGGGWSSSSTATATVASPTSGLTTGGAVSGTAIITYRFFATGCTASAVVTVNPLPPFITGPTSICVGNTGTMGDLSPGGTWSSSDGSIATIGSSSGIARGVSAGFVTITYTATTGCWITQDINILSLPSIITGSLHVCVGQTTILADSISGGTWTSTTPSIATVITLSASTGIAGGVAPGVDTIIYTLSTTCARTALLTVNSAPSAITGSHTVCVGQTTTLTDTSGTGTWSSACPTIATVGAATGIVSGVGSGVCTITYSLGGTCAATYSMSVNPLPSAFTVTGGGGICPGSTGVHIGTTGSTSGISYQLQLGGGPVGPPLIGSGGLLDFGLQTVPGTYTVIATNTITGCSRTMTGSVTISLNPTPALHNVTGGGSYCSGSTGVHIGLDGSDGGIRYQLYLGATPVGTFLGGTGLPLDFGVLTGAGTYIVIATNTTTGCKDTMSGSAVIVVNPLPTAFLISPAGPATYCAGGAGIHITLGGSATGFSYQLYNGVSPVGSPILGSGGVLDFGFQTAAGTYTIIATNTTTGCFKTMTGSVVITISPIPVISGSTAVCVGSTITLSSSTGTGTWVSGTPSSATVGFTTGVVTGVTRLTSTVITYTSSAGCTATYTVNVSPSPTVITGPPRVCSGSSVTETDTVTGGLWTSGNLSIASVGSLSGIVTGGAVTGPVLITYSLGTGCTVNRTMTVTAAPGVIVGPTVVCLGSTPGYTDAPGGTWSSSTPSVATIGISSGTLYTVNPGVDTITYTLGGCTAITFVTVAPAPGIISAPATSVCVGQTILLTDGVGGGTWTSSATPTATVGSTGIVTGVAGGTVTITYSLGGSCIATKNLTVNPITPIGGPTGLCVGASATLTDGATGGTWGSSATGIATVGLTSGIVTGGPGTGPARITYTTTAGCTAMTTINVSPSPGPIFGPTSVCVDATINDSDIVTGGLWSSSNTGVATVGSLSGTIYGVNTGFTILTYSLGGTCTRTATINVTPIPSISVTTVRICSLSTTTIGIPSPTGGTWTSSNPAIATVNTITGAVTGGMPGVDTITYTSLTGCSKSVTITINPLPSVISGSTSLCPGTTASLSDGTTGGTWSSSITPVATVGTLSGIVYGTTPGTTVVSYTLLGTGCAVHVTVNVTPPPPAIDGPGTVCAGQSITLTDTTAGGTWSSGDMSIATAVAGTGVITGVSSGTVIITYTTGTGCSAYKAVIVNPLSPVTGPTTVCEGQYITLTDTTAGGTWSSGSPGIAAATTAGSRTGSVYGVSPGTAVITYTTGTGCAATYIVTVEAAPPAITGPNEVCAGGTDTLTETTTGTWSSSDPVTAPVTAISPTTAVVTAGSVVFPTIVTITFTSSSFGCPRTYTITVNPVPANIGGPSAVCIGSTITLTDATAGGTWSSIAPGIATVGETTGVCGGIVAGATIISYSLPTGCATGTIITVDSLPSGITGPDGVCTGGTITLTDATTGGSWISGNTLRATVDGSGIVTGVATGPVTIYYMTAAGCTASKTLTVSPLGGIGGPISVCQAASITLTDFPTGGTWSSSDTTTAIINPVTGVATGVLPGSVTISYSLGTGCTATRILFVNPSPDPLGGSAAICLGNTSSLTETTTGGSWSSTNTTVATVDGGGLVKGVTTGTSTISYTLSGCAATMEVTVNPQPTAITGPTQVCTGASITLTDTITGGVWSSSDTTVATTPGTGVITGVNAGTAFITYSLGAGCTTITEITVNPLPPAILGNPGPVCAGAMIPLFDATSPSGTWASSSTTVATVDASAGVVSTLAAGTATIYYILGTGCNTTTIITVNAAPGTISGPDKLCQGTPVTFTDTPPSGVWSSSSTGVVSIDPSTGLATPGTTGAATISYSMGSGSGCTATKAVNVYALPQVFGVTGGGAYCEGGTGVPVGLNGSVTGVNYFLYLGGAATGSVGGTGSSISFGLQTVAGSYTVIATSTATTCSNIMSGSALVRITPSVLPVVGITANPNDTVCAGTSVTFASVPGTYAGTTPLYQWSVNGTNVGTGTTYTFIPANGDLVAVAMTSNYLCASPGIVHDTLRMTVNPLEKPGVGINISPNDTVCQGTTVTVTPAPLFGGFTPVYAWMRNGSAAGTGATYTFTPNDGDSVRCIMISDYPCILLNDTVSSAELVITVDTLVVPMVSITASPGINIGRNEFDTLTATVTNGVPVSSYQWYKNGYPVIGSTTNTYIANDFETSRQDSMSCIVTSDATCSATGFQWVYINASTVGVATITQGSSDITVVPNPNKGVFTIKGVLPTTIDKEVSIELTDMLGRVIYSSKIIAQNGRINELVQLNNKIANGMYMLSVHTGDENKIFHIVIEQ